MNFVELLHSFFDDSGAARLAQSAGLDATEVRRVLDAGLPLQLDALAAQAGTPTGVNIAEAVASLPQFESVGAVLNEPDGVSNLQQAGELLSPALLGDRTDAVARQAAGLAGTSQETATRVLTLTLPLLLSLLGRAGLTGANVGTLLGTLRAPAMPGGAAVQIPGLDGVSSAADLGGPELLDWLRAQLAGPAGERVGVAAGFSASGAGRATQAALPVLLAALVRRAGTDAGAQDLLDRSAATRDLVDAGGSLSTRLLGDPAEAARIEGQGRALLGTLFPNLDPVAGRLGSALGSSGASATRLLALLAPLLLALLGARARAGGLAAPEFRVLLAGLGGHLWGLLPAGLSGLSTLLDADSPAVAVPAAPAPVAPSLVAPSPVSSAPPATVAAPVPPAPAPDAGPARRRGFPWWLIPLLLLLGLGGCWLVNQNRPVPAVTGEAAAGLTVTEPESGAQLPPVPFTMSGTGPAGAALSIADGEQEVAQATVGADGRWTADLPAPAPGERTYRVEGGGASGERTVTVLDTATNPEDVDTTSTTDTPVAEAGALAITEPTSDATLPAGTFTLRGTGAPDEEVELFEDDTSLGKLNVGADGAWSFDVPSPAAGPHTYRVQGASGAAAAPLTVTVAAPEAGASAANCDNAFTLSMTDGRTVNEPFRFGGVGQGRGYSVTVKRGARVIGRKDVPLDATCGWSYQSRPGPGTITYEVRALGVTTGAAEGTVTLTVAQ